MFTRLRITCRGVKYSPKSFSPALYLCRKYSKASPFTSLSVSTNDKGLSLATIFSKVLVSSTLLTENNSPSWYFCRKCSRALSMRIFKLSPFSEAQEFHKCFFFDSRVFFGFFDFSNYFQKKNASEFRKAFITGL